MTRRNLLIIMRQIWSNGWADHYGPDWKFERDAALSGLQQWRRTECARRSPSTKAIVKELFGNMRVFNGLGKHMANDVLYLVGFWPTMPVGDVCMSDLFFARLRDGICQYFDMFHTKEFYKLVAPEPNSNNPFAFHYTSDRHYISRFVKVYRRSMVRMPTALYNQYGQEGLFDRTHVIGELQSDFCLISSY